MNISNQSPRLTFLGTGTSQGVPIIGCGCEVCRSDDPRDKRLRASALVDIAGLRILVDAGPDFRSQMLGAGVGHLDAILLTHNHKDHTGGLDDVRSLNYVDRRAAEIFCEGNVLDELVKEYPYVFSFPKYPGAPEWRLNLIGEKPFLIRASKDANELVWVHDIGYHYRTPDGSLIPTGRCLDDIVSRAEELDKCASEVLDEPFFPSCLADGAVPVVPIRGIHGKMPILGFRFGDIAYLTDVSSIPEREYAKLSGLKHLTLNTVSYKPHHSHFSLKETLEVADKVGATNTWLTHLSHTFPTYELFCDELREMCLRQGIRSSVLPAYDGLSIG